MKIELEFSEEQVEEILFTYRTWLNFKDSQWMYGENRKQRLCQKLGQKLFDEIVKDHLGVESI